MSKDVKYKGYKARVIKDWDGGKEGVKFEVNDLVVIVCHRHTRNATFCEVENAFGMLAIIDPDFLEILGEVPEKKKHRKPKADKGPFLFDTDMYRRRTA